MLKDEVISECYSEKELDKEVKHLFNGAILFIDREDYYELIDVDLI